MSTGGRRQIDIWIEMQTKVSIFCLTEHRNRYAQVWIMPNINLYCGFTLILHVPSCRPFCKKKISIVSCLLAELFWRSKNIFQVLIYPDSRFMGPTWGLSGADRTQMGPMLASWTLLSGIYTIEILFSGTYILHATTKMYRLNFDKCW